MLVGNVGTASGGLVVFSDAELDDGVLEIGVVTAEGTAQWLRVLGRAARKQADQSPFVHTTRGKKVDVRLDKASLYELDGGSRSKVKRLKYRDQAPRHHGSGAVMSTAQLIPETWELSGDDAGPRCARAAAVG